MLASKKNDIQMDADFLVKMIGDIPRLFPELASVSPADRQLQGEQVELRICSDGAFVREHAMGLVTNSPYYVGNSPPIIDKTWITFRWFQVHMLFALDLWCKYPKGVEGVGGERLRERLRHDALDAQYLIVGLLEGAFASNEKKLCKWWSLLNPEGKLYRV